METLTPNQIVEGLDPVAIRRELDELSARENALRVLLRAAVARKRRPKDEPTSNAGEAVQDAR